MLRLENINELIVGIGELFELSDFEMLSGIGSPKVLLNQKIKEDFDPSDIVVESDIFDALLSAMSDVLDEIIVVDEFDIELLDLGPLEEPLNLLSIALNGSWAVALVVEELEVLLDHDRWV